MEEHTDSMAIVNDLEVQPCTMVVDKGFGLEWGSGPACLFELASKAALPPFKSLFESPVFRTGRPSLRL